MLLQRLLNLIKRVAVNGLKRILKVMNLKAKSRAYTPPM
jgi:hypothetical protein